MSKEFREKFRDGEATKEEMRAHCQRPGRRDENGKLLYVTEQHHKKECDVNEIIKKYDKTGLIQHISKFEAKYGDMTGMDFIMMQQKVAQAKSSFESLPAEIRREFDNEPANLLSFMENPDNREKAIELGLISAEWTEETDGLGEHVDEGENVKKAELED